MKKLNQRTHMLISICMILLLFSTFLRSFPISQPLLSTLRYLFIFIVYTSILALRSIFIRQTILHESIKRYFLLTMGCILFFVFIYTFKYIAFAAIESVQRFLWYCSYIPSIFMPLFGFFVSHYVGQFQNEKLPFLYRLFYLPAFLMTIGILTNDIHQKAFRFQPDFADWESRYSFQFLYYIIGIWMLIFFILILFSLYRKSHVPGTKQKLTLPLTVMIIGLLYTLFNAFDSSHNGFIEITFMHCLLTALLWESYIYTGLIPSNTKYDVFFYSSPLGAQITDRNGIVKYTSKFASPLPPEVFKTLRELEKLEIYEGIQLHCSDIEAGYIIWQEDTSSIKKMIRQLRESEETLKSSVELLQEEIKITSHALHIKEQKHLYDLISKRTEKQLNRINLYMKQMSKSNKTEKDQLLMQTNVLGVYIKRCSNLILMAETQDILSAEELKRCFVESLASLRLYGATCRLSYELTEPLSTGTSIFLYECFEDVIEYFLSSLNLLWVFASAAECFLKLAVHIQGESLPCAERIAWSSNFGTYDATLSCTEEQQLISLVLTIPIKRGTL